MVVFNAVNSFIVHEIGRYYVHTFCKTIFSKFSSNAKTNSLYVTVANANCKDKGGHTGHTHFSVGRQLMTKTNNLNQTLSYHYMSDSPQYFPVPRDNFVQKDFQPRLLCIGRQSRHYPSFLSSKRHYSNNDRQHEPLPRLMDFPQIAWPSIFKVIKNWILTNFIITPYFDREFILQDFLNGSKQAVEYVSQCLAKGEYDKLEEVVSAEALREIKANISRFSVQQREDLAVCKDDIFFSFPYQVGVMFNENQQDEQVQQRFVEITVCYHVLKGLQELQAQAGKMPLNAGANTEFQDKVFILNYRFIREFTKGKSAEWTVNVVNHYRPSDYV